MPAAFAAVAPAAVLAMAVATALAGCMCAPQIEVDACFADRRDCAAAKGIVPWNETLAAAWPDVDALLRGTAEGEHVHLAWHGDGGALLRDLGADPRTRTAWVELEGMLYRVRQPVC